MVAARVRASTLWETLVADRARVIALLGLLVFTITSAAPAHAEPGRGASKAFVPARLLADAQRDRERTYPVIVQGGAASAADAVRDVRGRGHGLRKRFSSIDAVAADLTGAQILRLAARDDVFAISQDAPVVLAGQTYESEWPVVAGVPAMNTFAGPAIAVVDSGVDESHPAFGGRVVEQVNLTSLTPNAPGDGRGHGTFVASIAAGASKAYPGVAVNSKIVSIDVMDDYGMARVSDVIAACDWILRNKDRHGIRVANFSLHATLPSSFRYDPLDKAVERLWFSGVVVVVAAGNYGGVDGRVPFAPANDPFVITVGASDIAGSRPRADDGVAAWSAHGYTLDGFAKPDLVAPGRYMVGAVPTTSTMSLQRPDRIVAPRYMWMSGTSFSAPIVAGGAAVVLSRNPSWTPDQVKGALTSTTQSVPKATLLARGRGEVYITNAWDTANPPNPNAALNSFLVGDPNGGPLPVFDASAWSDAAGANSAWDSSAWSDSAWSDSGWSDSAWSDSAWSDSAWSDSAWSDSAWSDSAWESSVWVE